MGYDWFYYLKKAYALYPGVIRPVSADALRAHYRRRRHRRGAPRALLDAFMGVCFHLWVPWRSWRVQKHFGFDAAWRRRAAAVAHAAFADPNDIALFRIGNATELSHYIRRYEDAALNKLLNPLGWTRQCVLADKRLFAERCAAANLPHPRTIAVRARGSLQVLEDPDGRELVAKPADGEGGSGVRMLGPIADAIALRHLVAGWPPARGTLVIQPKVSIDRALGDLALQALPTVRIVTMRDERGTPEVVSATFRCPTDPAARVDNMKAGGLISPISLATGRLGLACLGYGGGDHTHHPVTGAPILDRELPGWHAARSLAIAAHAQGFPEYVLIGWDVALGAAGPVLIEGNGKPGVLMPQRAARAGLAQGRYGTLLAYHLEALSSH